MCVQVLIVLSNLVLIVYLILQHGTSCLLAKGLSLKTLVKLLSQFYETVAVGSFSCKKNKPLFCIFVHSREQAVVPLPVHSPRPPTAPIVL